jgi:predicted NUDIX family phosphoesterase
MSLNDENVICVSTQVLETALKSLTGWGRFKDQRDSSFYPSDQIPLYQVLNIFNYTESRSPIVLPRSEAETHKYFRHLIAYNVLSVNGQIFNYRRGKAGSEGRLHDLRSLGIGGHVNDEDCEGPLTADKLFNAVLREIQEEMLILGYNHCGPENLRYSHTVNYRGLIVDSSNEVGKVHVGVVYEFSYFFPLQTIFSASNLFGSRDHGLEDGKFSDFPSLSSPENKETYESWSKILINAMRVPVPTLF